MAGTLYSYPDSFRSNKALIAAQYSGADVKLVCDPPQFVLGETNRTPEFLDKFPLGKVPAFECADGTPIYESNAIMYYLATSQLRGCSSDLTASLVQQYVSLADNEILPAACTWVFPTLGIMQYNKQNTEAAQQAVRNVLSVLNKALQTRTFLVGERVTLADIACVCNLTMLYRQVLEPAFREPYVHVNRWYLTCINQPQFKAVLGDVVLCKKMAAFDAKKYNELFPKQGKEKKEGKKGGAERESKKEAPQKKEPKKKEPKVVEEEEDDTPPQSKFVDPYVNLPPSSFVLDAFKRSYSNEDTATKAIPFLWDNFDKEGWSMWKCEYKYKDELKRIFMSSNLVSGMLQRIEKLRKYAFASVLIIGEDNNNVVEGIWILRGQDLAFNLVPDWNIDAPSYNFTKLNPDSEVDKAVVNKYLLWEGDFGGREVADGKIFK